jgi:hypothetical protein
MEQEWSAQMQTVFFQAVILYRPIGMHKHFQLINIQRYINRHMGKECTYRELVLYLNKYFDLNLIDQTLVDELKEVVDFNLPFEDYNDLIEQVRECSESEESTPEKKGKKKVEKKSLKRPFRGKNVKKRSR